ncbi:hypothetical protein Tco_1455248, partial [Tanacetum coccineum]
MLDKDLQHFRPHSLKKRKVYASVRLVLDISLKDKNEAKSDKTEHEIGKSAKNQGQ